MSSFLMLRAPSASGRWTLADIEAELRKRDAASDAHALAHNRLIYARSPAVLRAYREIREINLRARQARRRKHRIRIETAVLDFVLRIGKKMGRGLQLDQQAVERFIHAALPFCEAFTDVAMIFDRALEIFRFYKGARQKGHQNDALSANLPSDVVDCILGGVAAHSNAPEDGASDPEASPPKQQDAMGDRP